jgi:hypothetical protein
MVKLQPPRPVSTRLRHRPTASTLSPFGTLEGRPQTLVGARESPWGGDRHLGGGGQTPLKAGPRGLEEGPGVRLSRHPPFQGPSHQARGTRGEGLSIAPLPEALGIPPAPRGEGWPKGPGGGGPWSLAKEGGAFPPLAPAPAYVLGGGGGPMRGPEGARRSLKRYLEGGSYGGPLQGESPPILAGTRYLGRGPLELDVGTRSPTGEEGHDRRGGDGARGGGPRGSPTRGDSATGPCPPRPPLPGRGPWEKVQGPLHPAPWAPGPWGVPRGLLNVQYARAGARRRSTILEGPNPRGPPRTVPLRLQGPSACPLAKAGGP